MSSEILTNSESLNTKELKDNNTIGLGHRLKSLTNSSLLNTNTTQMDMFVLVWDH